MRFFGLRFTTSVIAFLCLTPFCMANLDLGAAGAYTVLGLENTTVSIGMKNAIITGDVGISANGILDFTKGTINGDINLDATATSNAPFPGQVTHNGSLNTGLDLSGAVADAVNFSISASDLTATETFSSISSDQTVAGNGGLNVISVNTLSLSPNEALTLSGGANDIFVLNILDTFSMGNNSEIIADGISESQIIINLLGNASGTLRGTIDGTILAVGESVTLAGTLNGAIIAGAVELGNIDIESVVNGSTFSGSVVVPEPATLVLLGLGSLTLLRRRK